MWKPKSLSELATCEQIFVDNACKKCKARAVNCLLPQVLANGDLTLTDATNAWKEDGPLYAAIALSVVIAALCGMVVMGVVLYFGLKYLQQVNADLQVSGRLLQCHA